jgi:hypothetical protein
MKNVKHEALIWVQVAAFAAIWIVILYFGGIGSILNWDAVKALPDVVTVYAILLLVFTKWLWRWRIFSGWLVPFPDLQGTWDGSINTTWKDPSTGVTKASLPATLVVRQTFSSIKCVLFTQESDSVSTAAQISEDDDGGIMRLSYNYTNRPRATVRDRSAMHDGAALLRVVTIPTRKLEGEYWTSRCTTGDMAFTFRSHELMESLVLSSE